MTHRIHLVWLGMLLCCLASTGALHGQFAAGERREAAKKVAAAQRAVTEAMQFVAKAEQAVEGTAGEERKTSERLLAEARQKLDAARRELSRRNTEALDAAAQIAATRRGPYGPAQPEREHADPQDPYERLALLTPGGPVVVQVSLTIDGQPFRMAREKLIDDMLAAADKDKDGLVTWEEAVATPRFTLGQLGVPNPQARNSVIEFWDKNRDALVDRSEARQFLAQRFQGPTFTLGAVPNLAGRSGRVVVNGPFFAPGSGQADVKGLLDADADGALSAGEIAAAAQRLKSRDADDNDLLYADEIGAQAASAGVRRLPMPEPAAAVLLGPTSTADALYAAFSDRYPGAANFPALPTLFDALDEDRDGKLQKHEALALNDIEPHIAVSVDLGAQAAGKGLSITSLSGNVAEATKAIGSEALAVPGVRISLAAQAAAPQAVNYDPVAAAYITRFDKDSNGYLEKTEAPENSAQQFPLWDADEDGKVYAQEIAAAYRQMVAPQATQVVASVLSQGNSLFQALDQSSDSRLSVREMRSAPERILVLDEDGDGSVSQGEIPATISVTFSLGTAANGVAAYGAARADPGGAAANAASDRPEWFTRMDRNGDGDLSLKEFLGELADFRRLDADRDGLIDPAEAGQ